MEDKHSEDEFSLSPTVQCFIVYLWVMVQENSRPDDVTSTCLIPEFCQKLKHTYLGNHTWTFVCNMSPAFSSS